MKAVVLTAPGKAAIVERPVPIPGPGQVRLRVTAAGMCMTDKHIFHGNFPVPLPRVPGHEIAGTVEGLGPNVPSTLLGRQVGVQPARFCGMCPACRRDSPHLCANFQCLGNTHDGGYAEYILVDADQLVVMPDLAPQVTIWLEPLACVIHALMIAPPVDRQPVMVAGAGTFGRLFTQVLSRHYGIAVGVVDPNLPRLEQARALGAAATWQVSRCDAIPGVDSKIESWFDGGPSLLIETSGQVTSIERLLRWAGPGGTVLLFGVTPTDVQMQIQPAAIFSQGLHLTASAGMTPIAFEQAVTLLRSGVLDFGPLVYGEVSLEAVPDLLNDMPAGKPIIIP
jgi:D-arabinitol dehydrogenase (NADP+)